MRTLLIALFSVLVLGVNAQDKMNRPTSYNYQRGVEAIQKENTEEALEYLNKEISENPKNGYAFAIEKLSRKNLKELYDTCVEIIKKNN